MEQYAERIHLQFSGRVERAAPGLSVRPETFPLLTTRVHVPPVPLNLVARPQLISTLDRGIRQRKLTLLLAPAGSGKTTLLSAWRAAPAGNSLPAAWLSLDERDNEPGHFLAYLLLALQGIQGTDEFQRCAPDASSEPLSEQALIRLLNAIAASIAYDFVLVLDNYQVIAHPAIHRALAFVLQYAPRSMHLVIASRLQPPFPLIRLRAQGQLWEMTGQDLRFDAEEAALFLNTSMGLQLARHAVEELHQQSEGWITGLQLAACT
ncbi:MAG TPA: LuxR family transcriptional regulator, partial [Ktedonobacteraceae bacterium]|nr:LuxR family transcriptional regulator [Ktedonobacteraceae bacterium]